ncbi:MAG: carboxynorspermidine decarboxylase [Alphaproteobacteria bacterium]|nr:carboxynorspermidine decarboxylase [Alphaproteobacteria bacterium]
METRAGDPGAFAHFDLTRVPSPCFVVDEAAIRHNLSILKDVSDRSGARILLALKAFSMWSLGDLISEYLHGVCASGLWEARLGRGQFGGTVETYSPAYKADDIHEILRISDIVIFNTPTQHRRFASEIAAARADGVVFDVGLRINPEHSEGEVAKYDPARFGSRLGYPVSQLTEADLDGLDGLHFHTLCEQDCEPLKRTWAALEPRLTAWFGKLKWLNFGGGHHITRADYQREDLIAFLKEVQARTGLQIYLEPGEAIALDAGILVGEILDTFHSGVSIGITDVSATCHMPDVIEAPYRPALLGEPEMGAVMRLGGPSCLAGDIIGDYRFERPPQIGTRIAFLDQAHYSMVKTHTFNGVPLPAIALWNSDTDALRIVRRFGYADFCDRLS